MPKRKYWGLLPPMPAGALAETAKQCEAIGLEGVWAAELFGPPFVTLAGAAMVTTRLKLGSGVALAFVRSPLDTARAALDVDLISGGRCVLGIGPSVRWWNEDWFGVRYGKPIPHLREVIQIIRSIVAKGHTGDLGKIEGEYYKLNFDKYKAFYPPVRTEIPIYVPAVYQTACRLAGEIADGLPGHPIWCERWILDEVAPNVAKGIAKAGRKRSDFDLNIWLFVAPGPDKKQCIEDGRRTVAFYSQFEQYERYFAGCGFAREARAIIEAYKSHDEAAALRACSDAMVENFCLVGSIDEVRRRVDRIAGVADSFTLGVPFYGLAPEKLGLYNQRIAEGFYL